MVSPKNKNFNLPRIAFKMATGSGKTVVMATQILYHFFNRHEYRNDIRFADYFLMVNSTCFHIYLAVDRQLTIEPLIIEITGMNKDKAEKKWYVENRWLPAVNEVNEIYDYDEWKFIEIANDIRDIKNQLRSKINSVIQ